MLQRDSAAWRRRKAASTLPARSMTRNYPRGSFLNWMFADYWMFAKYQGARPPPKILLQLPAGLNRTIPAGKAIKQKPRLGSSRTFELSRTRDAAEKSPSGGQAAQPPAPAERRRRP